MLHTVTNSDVKIQLSIIVLIVSMTLLISGCKQELYTLDAEAAKNSGNSFSFGIIKHEIPEALSAGQSLKFKVILINNGTEPWDASSDGPLFLSYHWKHPGGKYNAEMFWGDRTVLPGFVAPGEMVSVDMKIETPDMSKFYDLTIDLMQGTEEDREKSTWFEERGWQTYDLRLEVTK